MLTDTNYRIKHSRVAFDVNCEKCNISRIYIEQRGRYVCTNCGEIEYVLTNLANYCDIQGFKKYSPYSRVYYLKDRLKRLQSNERTCIPETIITIIKNELFKSKIKTDKCTTKQYTQYNEDE